MAPQFFSPRNTDQSQNIDYEQPDGGFNTNPDLASFTPEIEHDQPYIPVNGGYAGQRYQNPNYVPNQQPNQNGRPQINHADLDPSQWSQGARRPGSEDIGVIRPKFDTMTRMVESLGGAGIVANGDDSDEYALNVAVENLSAAIDALNSIDYWCPKLSRKFIPKLEAGARPIVAGLQAYINVIAKLR